MREALRGRTRRVAAARGGRPMSGAPRTRAVERRRRRSCSASLFLRRCGSSFVDVRDIKPYLLPEADGDLGADRRDVRADIWDACHRHRLERAGRAASSAPIARRRGWRVLASRFRSSTQLLDAAGGRGRRHADRGARPDLQQHVRVDQRRSPRRADRGRSWCSSRSSSTRSRGLHAGRRRCTRELMRTLRGAATWQIAAQGRVPERAAVLLHRASDRLVAGGDRRRRRRVLRRHAERPRARRSPRPRHQLALRPGVGLRRRRRSSSASLFYLVATPLERSSMPWTATPHGRPEPDQPPTGIATRSAEHARPPHASERCSLTAPQHDCVLGVSATVAAPARRARPRCGSSATTQRRRRRRQPTSRSGGGADPRSSCSCSGSPRRQFAGYFAAVDQGFYKDEGLDVEILEGGVDIVPQTVLAQGNADFAIAWVPKALAVARAGRQDHRRRARSSSGRGTLQVAFKDKNITTAADLKGKKVGNWGFGNEYELFAGMTKAGLDPAKDVSSSQQQFDMNGAAQRRHRRRPGDDLQRVRPGAGGQEPGDRASCTQPSDFNVINWNDRGLGMLQDAIWARHRQARRRHGVPGHRRSKFIKASIKGWATAGTTPRSAATSSWPRARSSARATSCGR